MKIFLDNVNLNSSSGPNTFGKRLKNQIQKLGDQFRFDDTDPDVQLSFITATRKIAPLVLRLDGIYFNTRQDWEANNVPIKRSFDASDIVVYQSEFNRRLTEKYFGKKESVVIGNGTCLECVSSVETLKEPALDNFSEVWTCSSSWRPHKRLKENIRYFLEKAPRDACLVVAGENPDYLVRDARILYAGHLPWEKCISLYKRSKVFLHLAFLDHCPNVVVDARASGCHIVVSSSGGTREISGIDSTVVQDVDWDMSPLDLYDPPQLDLSKTYANGLESTVDIRDVASKYIDCLLKTSGKNEKTNT